MEDWGADFEVEKSMERRDVIGVWAVSQDKPRQTHRGRPSDGQ